MKLPDDFCSHNFTVFVANAVSLEVIFEFLAPTDQHLRSLSPESFADEEEEELDFQRHHAKVKYEGKRRCKLNVGYTVCRW